MTTENFCYWLQGFIEIQKPNGISPEQVKEIKNHLDLVFRKETPYVFPDNLSKTYCSPNSSLVGDMPILIC